MIYPSLSLKLMMVLVGLVLILSHGIGLSAPQPVQKWLKSFPRSKGAGMFLLVIAALWFLALVTFMDLGEFTVYKRLIQILTVVAGYLSLRYADEFLAVRALGMVFLLAAEPVIETAFLRPETVRLLLVVLAYAWVIAGLFWVGMPYLLRDQIAWISKTAGRWKIACLAGVLYGAALIIGGLLGA